MFFQGALLSDPDRALVEQGPNSRSAKRLEFSSVADVERSATAISSLVEEAIEIQDSGPVVEPAPQLVLAEELQARIAEDPDFAAAFQALTPGRQREYHLHVCSRSRHRPVPRESTSTHHASSPARSCATADPGHAIPPPPPNHVCVRIPVTRSAETVTQTGRTGSVGGPAG
jgi:hypothetical protein